jgi:hypothetical protein
LVVVTIGSSITTYGATSLNPNPPDHPVRLIFIHHSTGENWLSDENGGLGIALRDNNYYASDTNYGWGPDNIGDRTDIGNWWEWFRGSNSSTYLNALYNEGEQHSSYSRLSSAPSGENEIIMFKPCFPNSALQGDPNDLVPSINNNPLRGEGSGSEYHTVANAKGIYIDLLEYFRTRQDKLFIVITAPPLSDPEYTANARYFNNWLVNDWLKNYPYNNVFVFDFYNVLTTNGGNANTNDLGQETGNHHRWWNNINQHKTDGDNDSNPNILEYPSGGDDHPSQAGNLKATGEFVTLLNVAYHRCAETGVPPLIGNLENPSNGQTVSGITTIHGWAIDGKKVTKVELYVNGTYAGDIPYGGSREDVRDVYPQYPSADLSGFGLIMNYSILSPGNYNIVVRLHNQDGQTKDLAANVTVVRFHGDFATQVVPDSFWLNNVSVTIEGVTKTYNIRVQWSNASQGFEIVEVVP